MELKPEDRRLRLAALAGWRPRPGDGPPHGGKAEAAQAWVRFWEKRYRTPSSKLDGLIAAAALLHLAEAGWLPSGPSPERLREEFHQRVQQWSIRTCQEGEILRILVFSVPADASAPERRQQDIKAWLELTHENVRWEKREAIWEMLAAWQRESVLERCGIDKEQLQKLSLLPDLARALKWERDSDVLQAMAGYIPGAVEVSAHPEVARAVVAHWEALSRSDNGRIRQAAWVARWNLLRGEVLTTEKQARFAANYVDTIRSEQDQDVLLTLAQITPPGTFPLATWAGRLSDQGDWRRLAAQLAIHGWLVEVAGGGQRIASSGQRVASNSEASGEQRVASRELPLATHHSPLAITHRQMRQVLRRAGQDIGDGTVAPFVNLPPEMLPDFRRLREIETALAAGQMPPPPDAAAENRATPRVVPARLPEAHPQTQLTSVIPQRDGSEIATPHPFPEVIRHE